MDSRILRFAYGTEFLVALIAIFTFWSQVGGQTHLDLMPWYLKFGISMSAAAAIVKLTARGGRVWWGVLISIIAGAALVTYYYHLYEPMDPDDSGDSTITQYFYCPTTPVKGLLALA